MSAATFPRPALDQTDHTRFDLSGNLERFVWLAADRLRYDPVRRRWLVRTADGWRVDDGAAMRTACAVTEFVADDTARSGDPKAIWWATSSGMIGTLNKLVRLARMDPRLQYHGDEM